MKMTDAELADRLHELVAKISAVCTNAEAGQWCLGFIVQYGETLAARLAADQQKGGGECNCSSGRGAEHCVVHAPNGSLQAFDAITTPQPSIPEQEELE